MENQLKYKSIHEQLVDQIKSIDVSDDLSDDESGPVVNVAEEQKIYFWIRLYIKDENLEINQGDDINLVYTPSGELLETKFICYGKQGLEKDFDNQVTSYNPEDDKKILCLMIDSKVINYSNDIPFIRTLFKTGYHYEYQLVKRDELIFKISKNDLIIDYYDIDF